MGLDYPTQVYLPCYNVFARTIVVIPLASQPGEPAYEARGIFNTESLDVVAEDGSLISDQRTILDIREAEFAVLPTQFDQIDIPDDPEGPAKGVYEVKDASSNGGGETTLVIRLMVEAMP